MNTPKQIMVLTALLLATVSQGAEKTAVPAEPVQTGRPPLTVRPVGDKAIIHTVADALGFVRWVPPRETTDTLNRLQWLGTGTQFEGGKTYKVAHYSYALTLSLTGAREDIQRVAPNGTQERIVRAFLGDTAWDESAPGVNAKSVDAGQARERRFQFLRTPFGFTRALLKADAAAIKITDPGAGGAVRIELTVDGVPVTATLDPYYRPASISTQINGKRIQVAYGRYRSINEYGVMFPTRIAETVAGQPRLTLSIDDARIASYLILQPPPTAAGSH